MKRKSRGMLVLGLMSGTSADGIDVALVKISGAPPHLAARLEKFAMIPYPPRVRNAVLRLANGAATTPGELSQLNFRLGELFAKAALESCRRFRVSPRQIQLIGSHGQTLYHQGRPRPFLGSPPAASTLQLGEPAIIAARTGITTVADFRPADIAAGGQGAPLVPFVDYLLCRDARRGRIALNLGGIANLTVIPPATRPEEVIAFDTGPSNMVIDALATHFTRGRLKFDQDARLALRGKLLPDLLQALMKHPYFRERPPKSAGREQFGSAFVEKILAWGRKRRARPADLLHTATALTPIAVSRAFYNFVYPQTPIHEIILSGGGALNPLIVAYLSRSVPGIDLFLSSRYGIPVEAKEAMAFAILAYESFHGRPNNLPSATGARHPVVLGKIIHAHRG